MHIRGKGKRGGGGGGVWERGGRVASLSLSLCCIFISVGGGGGGRREGKGMYACVSEYSSPPSDANAEGGRFACFLSNTSWSVFGGGAVGASRRI